MANAITRINSNNDNCTHLSSVINGNMDGIKEIGKYLYTAVSMPAVSSNHSFVEWFRKPFIIASSTV